MRSAVLLLLLAASLVCGFAADAPTPVLVPGTGVSMVPPEGFVQAAAFVGFEREDWGASIVVSVIEAPYSGVALAFTKANMAKRGMELMASEPARYGEADGVLVQVRQTARGIAYVKWIAAFGVKEQTVLVTANVPEVSAKEGGAAIVAALRTIRNVPGTEADPFATVPFTLEVKAPFQIMPAMTGAVGLIPGDAKVPIGPGTPLFMVAPAMGKVTVREADLPATALARLQKTALMTNIVATAQAATTINGLKGYAITATAEDADDKAPLLIYQVMLLIPDGYVLIQGRCPRADVASLESFKAMAATVKLKAKA